MPQRGPRLELVASPGRELDLVTGHGRAALDPGARLLIRLPNWLGDLLLARPMLAAVGALLPEAEIRLIAPGPLLALVDADLPLAQHEPWPSGSGARRALAARLRRWRPSCALVLPPSFSSAWFAWVSGARVRVGYREQGRDLLLTHGMRRPARGELHLADEYLALARHVGLEPRPLGPLALPERAHDAARARLGSLGLERRPYTVLGPGAAYGPAKRWSHECFAAVGRARIERGEAVLVCGVSKEREVCRQVAEVLGGDAHLLAGETELIEQAALCAGASLAVCNDSGLAHLAAACGTPTVSIFGSTSSAWSAPCGDHVRIVQHAPVCSPCFQRTCRIGYRCLEAVTAAEVTSVAAQVARGRLGLGKDRETP